jgi:hypothetical protein
MSSYEDILARQQQQHDFLDGLKEQHDASLRSAAENQIAVAGLWVAMGLREQYLRNKLGPAGYERHSSMVTTDLGVALMAGAVLIFLAGVTGWHGAVLSVCGIIAALIGVPGLYFIRSARVRYDRLNRWRGDGG